MIRKVFLDLHDTLIYDRAVHEKAEAKLCGYLSHFGLDETVILETFNDIDKELLPSMGYSSKRVIRSFETTLRTLVPEHSDKDLRMVRSYAEEIYTLPPQLKPGVIEAVELLSQYFDVSIMTSSAEKDRVKRQFDMLPFKNRISNLFIFERKDADAYAQALAETGYAAEETVMIGNSKRSDIEPSTAVGMQAIYIEATNSQHIEDRADDMRTIITLPKNAYEFTSILEAAQHLVTYKSASPMVEMMFSMPAINRNKEQRTYQTIFELAQC